jgi:hypothetical protein
MEKEYERFRYSAGKDLMNYSLDRFIATQSERSNFLWEHAGTFNMKICLINMKRETVQYM